MTGVTRQKEEKKEKEEEEKEEKENCCGRDGTSKSKALQEVPADLKKNARQGKGSDVTFDRKHPCQGHRKFCSDYAIF